MFDRQNSTLIECNGSASVKWDRNKVINAVVTVCVPVVSAFPNASGEYDLGPVVGSSTETSSLRGLLWFVASQRIRRSHFVIKASSVEHDAKVVSKRGEQPLLIVLAAPEGADVAVIATTVGMPRPVGPSVMVH